jgi:hypothetical protein
MIACCREWGLEARIVCNDVWVTSRRVPQPKHRCLHYHPLSPQNFSPLYFMFAPSIVLRRLPLFTTSRALSRTQLLTPASHLTRHHPAFFSHSAFTMDKNQSRGDSTTGISEWKQRPPYRVHDKQEGFDVKYEANCHCGKVKYQLNRQEPLDSKLCHCTTCQTQHGMSCSSNRFDVVLISYSRTIPVGRYLSQGGYQLHPWPPRPRVVRPY